jgi:hypothetical protein
MRTTLQIDDDIYEAVRSLATARKQSVGRVLSELARTALAPRSEGKRDRGFPVFSVSRKAAPLTLEMVRAALDDEP